jgi:hypothetical protein
MQVVAIATRLTEASAGFERTHESLQQSAEDSDPRRTFTLAEISGNVR